jgi:mRNA interferase YafQ
VLPNIVHINKLDERQLVYSNSFERTLKKLLRKQPSLANLIINTLSLLVQNPFNPSLGSHKVYGDQKIWSSVINFSIRVLWTFDENRNIELRSIGDHDTVY